MCRICYSGTSSSSVDTYGKTDGAIITSCLMYSDDGSTDSGWDGILIPGARLESTDLPAPQRQCANDHGLIETASGPVATICCKFN